MTNPQAFIHDCPSDINIGGRASGKVLPSHSCVSTAFPSPGSTPLPPIYQTSPPISREYKDTHSVTNQINLIIENGVFY